MERFFSVFMGVWTKKPDHTFYETASRFHREWSGFFVHTPMKTKKKALHSLNIILIQRRLNVVCFSQGINDKRLLHHLQMLVLQQYNLLTANYAWFTSREVTSYIHKCLFCAYPKVNDVPPLYTAVIFVGVSFSIVLSFKPLMFNVMIFVISLYNTTHISISQRNMKRIPSEWIHKHWEKKKRLNKNMLYIFICVIAFLLYGFCQISRNRKWIPHEDP